MMQISTILSNSSDDIFGKKSETSQSLDLVLKDHYHSFTKKVVSEESEKADDIMLVFGLNKSIKSENKQYWNKQLSRCWQLLVLESCHRNLAEFQGPLVEQNEQLCDLVIGNDAIETRYRIGSLGVVNIKKLKNNAAKLENMGLRPVLLILRDDNLPQAITACNYNGWTTISGKDAYTYIHKLSGFDLKSWLQTRRNLYRL